MPRRARSVHGHSAEAKGCTSSARRSATTASSTARASAPRSRRAWPSSCAPTIPARPRGLSIAQLEHMATMPRRRPPRGGPRGSGLQLRAALTPRVLWRCQPVSSGLSQRRHSAARNTIVATVLLRNILLGQEHSCFVRLARYLLALRTPLSQRGVHIAGRARRKSVALRVQGIGAPVEVRRHPGARRLTLRVSKTRRCGGGDRPDQCRMEEADRFLALAHRLGARASGLRARAGSVRRRGHDPVARTRCIASASSDHARVRAVVRIDARARQAAASWKSPAAPSTPRAV